MNKRLLFVAQEEYFRQCIYDALSDDNIEAFWVKSIDPETIRAAFRYCIENDFDILCMFRPEWAIYCPNEYLEIREKGIKCVGYSTEPVPYNNQENIHDDQILRLNNLLNINDIDLDLLIHYDEASSDAILKNIKHKVVFSPLPVSKKLFYKKENVNKKFDSVFFGRSTDRRENFLSLPKALHNHLHIAHGLVDEDACEFYNRSKVSINIHNLDYPGFEVRVIQSLLCGTPVFTEDLSRNELNHLEGLKSFQDKDELWEYLNSSIEYPDMDKVISTWENLYDVNILLDIIESNL